ncbi:MFS transporter [Bradyrhizobium niftali]|jgi:MFS family permease|nr:MFS transporter [Bradyrhizobium niftali]
MSNSADVMVGTSEATTAVPITAAFRKLVIASSLGSVIEHYDFFIYAFTAPVVFDRFFFPKMDSTASMLAVYATFAVGFVARPLGGMVFGHYGDQLGRKAMLTITFVLMGVASFLIGCLPSYDSIGLLAPIALVALRFVQGFAFGGEYMNAVSLTLENAPSARRGFFASFVNASGPIGVILASGFIALLGLVSTPQDFAQWVWRVPFVLSLVLVVLGTYIRLQVDESALFKAVQASAARPRAPLLDVVRSWKKPVLFGCLVNMAHSTFQYMSTVFVLGYAVKTLGMAQSHVTFGTMVANVLEMCMVPLIASYSDRFGRRPFIALGTLLAAAWYPIYFQLVASKDPTLLITGLVVSIGIIHALMFAPEAAFTAELFPTEVRVSGSSLGKQLGIILGGGIAPLVGTALMGSSGSFTPVILYFEAIAACAFIGILLAPESAKRDL